MRGFLTFALTIFFCFTNFSIAQNVSVTDYKVPVSSAGSFFIDVNSSYAVKDTEMTAAKGNIGLNYKRFYDSLPRGYSLDAVGSFALEKDVESGKFKSDYFTDANTRYKEYIFKGHNLFGSLKLHGAYLKGVYDYPATDITVSMGYGRFTNATALAKAVRIEDFLLKEGILSDRMPEKNMIELAKVIDRRSAYREKFGFAYRGHWYEDMEEQIRRSGKLKGERISTIGVIRIQEVLTRERIADKFYGWDVSLGTKQELTSPKKEQERPPPALDITAHYARPIGWKMQWNEGLDVSSPFGKDFGKKYSLSINSDFSYELANRVDLNVQHSLKLDKLEADERVTLSNFFRVVLVFYMENHINLVISEQVGKSGNQKVRTSFTAALNYRIF